VALHEGLGKSLGALELCRRLRGAKDAQALGAKDIDDARRQRPLGADHGQGDALLLRPARELGRVADRHVLQRWVERGAAVARRHINLRHARRLLELPGQRVFAPATADHQHLEFCVHGLSSAL